MTSHPKYYLTLADFDVVNVSKVAVDLVRQNGQKFQAAKGDPEQFALLLVTDLCDVLRQKSQAKV